MSTLTIVLWSVSAFLLVALYLAYKAYQIYLWWLELQRKRLSNTLLRELDTELATNHKPHS